MLLRTDSGGWRHITRGAAAAAGAGCAPGASFIFDGLCLLSSPPRWVTTPAYDPSNRRHVAIVDEIIIGNGLPVSGLGLMQGSAPSPSDGA